MEDFISIVLIVFAVLQIILFFKVWGMTDDVRKLKNSLVSGKSTSIVYTAIKKKMLGQTEDAAKFLIQNLDSELDSILEERTEKYIETLELQKRWNSFLKTCIYVSRYLDCKIPQSYIDFKFEDVMDDYNKIINGKVN